MTRSIASVISDRPIVFLLRRAARIAASLTRFSRSAPENPGVCRARSSTETSSSSGLPRECTSRIARRPWISGRSRMTWRSNRPGRSKRGIEHVRPVGGRDHDHIRAAVEPVHLDQDLVERLLALVVTAAEPGAALATDRVDLIDEDDARRAFLGLIEEIADPAGADADEHLDKLGTGDAEETARLPRISPTTTGAIGKSKRRIRKPMDPERGPSMVSSTTEGLAAIVPVAKTRMPPYSHGCGIERSCTHTPTSGRFKTSNIVFWQ